ncbi:MAG: 16S rRNA (cytidine(1402)-2'-O)-methyltransferase [Rhodobiaceae bacterium]|nr:16S rRNA (cytidine(1402)-2'-O)-methyltransferase [Rhodobiaceae bacterium]
MEGAAFEAKAAPAGLHVVATPIGNLGDITVRALETLAGADRILCEDTRVTRRLTTHYGIRTPLEAFHEHNAEKLLPKVLDALAAGAAVALVSDAGTPLISDPGYRLVDAARTAGHAVHAIPGASALTAALSVAGLATDAAFFAGFLPQKQGARRARLAEIAAVPGTLVVYEAPHRLVETLSDMAETLGDRRAAVARELTKKFEEVTRGSFAELIADYANREAVKGEIVVLVERAAAAEASEADVDALLTDALAGASLRDAVAAVTAETGLPRKLVYARALALEKERS